MAKCDLKNDKVVLKLKRKEAYALYYIVDSLLDPSVKVKITPERRVLLDRVWAVMDETSFQDGSKY